MLTELPNELLCIYFRDEDDDVCLLKKKPEKKTVYRWRKKEPPMFNRTFQGDEFSLPARDDMTPFEYFKLFWNDSITQNLVEQTNLYSVQVTGTSIATNVKEMEQFLGIQMLMSLVRLPSYELYWSTEFRCSVIADVMSLKRYERLRKFLHMQMTILQETKTLVNCSR